MTDALWAADILSAPLVERAHEGVCRARKFDEEPTRWVGYKMSIVETRGTILLFDDAPFDSAQGDVRNGL